MHIATASVCVFFLHEKAIKTVQINLSLVFRLNLYPILFTLSLMLSMFPSVGVTMLHIEGTIQVQRFRTVFFFRRMDKTIKELAHTHENGDSGTPSGKDDLLAAVGC
jgi:hypothetical protein